jgi:predicted N-acyltransferase
MNWKGISLFFILLVASFGLSLMNYSPTEISLTNSYALETERVRISGTDFSMQILKGYRFTQGNKENAGIMHDIPYLPTFWVSAGKIEPKTSVNTEKFLSRAHDSEFYTNLKEYNLDGIQIYIAKRMDVLRSRDIIVSAWVLYEDQTLYVNAWGPIEKVNEVYAMLETMLLTLRVETEE